MARELTVSGLCFQSQRQVQRRFEACLAGKPLPGQRVGTDSPMSAGGSATSAVRSQPAQHSKPGKKQQPSSMRPGEHSPAVDKLVSAVREAVASCVASGVLPEAGYSAPLVQEPSVKQAKLLPPAARCGLDS